MGEKCCFGWMLQYGDPTDWIGEITNGIFLWPSYLLLLSSKSRTHGRPQGILPTAVLQALSRSFFKILIFFLFRNERGRRRRRKKKESFEILTHLEAIILFILGQPTDDVYIIVDLFIKTVASLLSFVWP